MEVPSESLSNSSILLSFELTFESLSFYQHLETIKTQTKSAVRKDYSKTEDKPEFLGTNL
jgi:hypothetical protein